LQTTLTGVSPASTSYTTFSAAGLNGTEANRQTLMPRAGTITRFYLRTTNAQPGDGTLTATVRVNGVDTAATLVVAAGAAAGTFSSSVVSVAVAAGDLVSISLVNTSPGTSSASVAQFSALFQ